MTEPLCNKMSTDLAQSRILFFVPHENVKTSGVFASQVLGLARFCANLGAESLIFHYAPDEEESCIEIEPHIKLLNSTEKTRHYSIFTVVRAICRIEKKYRSYFTRFAPTHIYTRNYAMCIGIRSFARECGARLVYSMRGPDVYERTRSGRIRDYIAGLFVGRLVRKAVRCCDVFTSMSKNAVDWVAQKYCKKGIVFPCCVDKRFFLDLRKIDRHAARYKLGFQDTHKVIVWSGNLAYWQRLDDIIRLIKGMSELDDDVRILFITREKIEVKIACEAIGLDEHKYRIISSRPDEVQNYLGLCDVGIDCLAVDDFKSSICCPIKVGEYLAVGLPILITRTMGDIPEMVNANMIGAILEDGLNPRDAVQKLNSILSFDSDNIQHVAFESFSWDSHRDAVIKLFE